VKGVEGIGESLVVPIQVSEPCRPSEASFHHPATQSREFITGSGCVGNGTAHSRHLVAAAPKRVNLCGIFGALEIGESSMVGRFKRAWRKADFRGVAGLKVSPSWVQAAAPVHVVRGPFGALARAVAPVGNTEPMVTSGAVLSCSCSIGGLGVLNVLPPTRAANVNDGIPMLNIPSFGMCGCPANPQVAAATAASLGTLTPVTCIPVTSKWNGGLSNQQVDGSDALQPSSTIQCAWGGEIAIQASQY
jgi:hypothetical protein